MNRAIGFVGCLGLLLLAVGLLVLGLGQEQHHFGAVHAAAGAFLLVVFFIRGGLSFFASLAVRRTLGFGVSVFVYSLLFLAVVVGLNYAAWRSEIFRYDSTAEKVYTLAPQTHEVLRKLDRVLLIRAFYVGGQIDRKTEQLLDRFCAASPKVTWRIVDLEKSPGLAKKLGVSESETLHLSYNVGDATREARVSKKIDEQEVVNAILRLTRGGKRVLYFVQGHGEPDLYAKEASGFSSLRESVEGEAIEVRKLVLAETKSVPSDASCVLIIAPAREFLPFENEALLNYLRGGGGMVLLHEPKTSSAIQGLVEPLGISAGSDVVVDQELRVFGEAGLGVQPVVTAYGQHEITKGFAQGTVFSTVSSVRRGDNVPQGAEVSELAFTGPNSWAETDLELLYSEEPRAAYESERGDIKGPVSIAAAFEGRVANASHSRLEQQEVDAASQWKQSKSRVVVIGDFDFVANINIRQLFNRDFFLNALNWAMGEAEGVTIRPRTMKESRTIVPQRQLLSLFLFSAVLVPEILLIVGLGCWWFRRD